METLFDTEPIKRDRFPVSKFSGRDSAVIKSLLNGNFILQRGTNRQQYVVYDAKMNPLLKVKQALYKKLYPIIKKDKKGRITLNLTKVRQLHGNEQLKKEYKNYKSSQKDAKEKVQG